VICSEIGGSCSTYGRDEKLTQKIGKPRGRWEDIKIDVIDIGYQDFDCIHLAQGRDPWRAVVKTVMSLWVP
jgi:hypothetical protein